jgi:hypothetical protein
VTPYTAYGLQVDSEVPLPELLPGSNQSPDVQIRYGSVPTSLPDPLGQGGYFQAAPDTFLLRVRNTARYLVVKGQEIVIERLPNCSEDALRLYLLGSAFGALLHQRRLLVMHASSIETARGAVLFVGPSGHGKSTLLAALVQRGYAMLADDVTAVTVEPPSGPVAFAAFPHMRLCADAATRLDYRLEGLPRVYSPGRISVDKYLVPVPHFCATPLPVHALYTLNVHAPPDIHLESVDNVQRFALVGANTYRHLFLEGLGLRQMHFHAAARMAKTVQVGCITRPASPYLLEELVDRLEVELGGPIGMIEQKIEQKEVS